MQRWGRNICRLAAWMTTFVLCGTNFMSITAAADTVGETAASQAAAKESNSSGAAAA